MRFHVPGLAHTVTSRRFNGCAFSTKVRHLCTMLHGLGHEVIHYGVEGAEVPCERVNLVLASERDAAYPVDLSKQVAFDCSDAYHARFNAAAIEAILARSKPHDFLLCPWGVGHKKIADAMPPSTLVVESGIGYENTFARFRVWESHAWMHYIYGRSCVNDGIFMDAVIPNAFDPAEFEYRPQKGDYHLYVGRLIARKGVDIAIEATRRAGVRLVIAGQGSLVDAREGTDLRAPHVEFVGFADVARRRELMAGAAALWAPTRYVEPFGGVTIEAALSGTPVITTDFGVYGETILHGKTGYRCRALEHFVWAARNVARIRAADCLAWAQGFTLDRVAMMYDEYFTMLSSLWGDGWYAARDDRRGLDWLARARP